MFLSYLKNSFCLKEIIENTGRSVRKGRKLFYRRGDLFRVNKLVLLSSGSSLFDGRGVLTSDDG